MIKVLFLIHDLGAGGAEKVLVNLVNNMNQELFDITVMALFGGGVNEQYLSPHVHYRCVYNKMIRGNSYWMKLKTPETLHKDYIKEHYDIEVAYLEGPSARIISGCSHAKTRLVSWIHSNIKTMDQLSKSFRTQREALACYQRFHKIICVSKTIEHDFQLLFNHDLQTDVLYNTVDSASILEKSYEDVSELRDDVTHLIAVGTLKEVKGYFRLLSIIKRLIEERCNIHLSIAGQGPLEGKLDEYIKNNHLEDYVTLLGYQSNPYKYVKHADLFVCSSFSEGFSTAATEALIVGTPVCTVEVSGMKEMLGEKNEYGLVTENSEEALYEGIKSLLDDPELLIHYQKQAKIRGQSFRTESTVKAVEEMFINLMEGSE